MNSNTFAHNVYEFLTTLLLPVNLPNAIEVLWPFNSPEVQSVVKQMSSKYYLEAEDRIGMWGINPGRLGAGLTGLSFTDPHSVKNLLGIPTNIEGRREPSAQFIQLVIEAYGGPATFYKDVYLGAVCPLGFVRDGKNINFYDDKDLMREIVPFVLETMSHQHNFGVRTDSCIVLGANKLRDFFERFVQPTFGFDHVVYLNHPRYIMQYRRPEIQRHVDEYVQAIRTLVKPVSGRDIQ